MSLPIAMDACPNNELLAAWARGSCSNTERAAVGLHLDACASCRRTASALAELSAKSPSATEPSRVLPFAPGDIILERFRMERVLGVGGMGYVVEATHTGLNERFALKFMLPHLHADPSADDRFIREARAAAQLKSEHICRVVDVGRLPDGSRFMVMEFLEGQTLEQKLSIGPLAVPEATALFRQMLMGLQEAHARGVVHRDLKPANLFLTQRADGSTCLKVLDFGVAKSADTALEEGLSRTHSGTFIGSPLYMAPEQLTPFAHVDARADVWAAGCVLYAMLTGAPPFEAPSLATLAESIRGAPHTPVRLRRSDVSPSLAILIDACLAKSANERPANAATVLAMLDASSSSVVPKPKRSWALVAAGAVMGVGLLAAVALRKPVREPSLAMSGSAVNALAPLPPAAIAPLPAPVEVETVDAGPKVVAPRSASEAPKRKAASAPSPDDILGERR